MCKHNDKTSRFMQLMLVALFVGILPSLAETATDKTYRDSPEWALLPKGPDLDDEADERDFQQLVAEGGTAQEALLSIVRECEDPMLASRALAVLRISSGDKSKVREELKQILAERLPHASGPEEWLMTSIAEALVVMGNERDMEALAPMLVHPTRRVRIIGARCMGKRGGQSAIAMLENAKRQNPEKRALEEIDAAIGNIEKRLAEHNSQAEPDKTDAQSLRTNHVETENSMAPANAKKSAENEALPDAAKRAAEPSYEKYPEWTLFSKGIDCDTPSGVEARQRIVDMGPSAHEALLAIVRECDDPCTVRSALGILREAKENKAEIVGRLKPLFEARLAATSWAEENMLLDLASALAAMGKEEDLTVLFPMLSHPSAQVRGACIRLLGRYGGLQTLQELENAKTENSSILERQGMDDAAARIVKRLAEPHAFVAPAP